MQKDMHYYGTYALALAAGLKADICQTIATASQYVDDNASQEVINLADGGCIDVVATAHTMTAIQNVERDDQRRVWAPFHFLPGCQGNSLLERLICRKNSDVAQRAVAYNLSFAKEAFAVELIGVTAHVYADTFSHYDFAGISSPYNAVTEGSIQLDSDLPPENKASLLGKAANFLTKDWAKAKTIFTSVEGDAAQDLTGYLGHAGAATYPDQPYLKWSYANAETKEVLTHDNPATFLEACQALYTLFRNFAAARTDLCTGKAVKSFDEIKAQVEAILNSPKEMDDRSVLWQEAASQGAFTGSAENIPPYDGDSWNSQAADSKGKIPNELEKQSFYRFHQASEVHRTHVMRVLLPQYGVHLT